MMPLIFFPLFNVYLSLNWRRLGKPEWTPFALGASVITGLGVWLCLFVMFTMSSRFGDASIIALVVLGMATFWLYDVMLHLQNAAYKNWKTRGDEALYQHVYRVKRSMLLWGTGVVVVVGAMVGYYAYEHQPRVFTDPSLTMPYDSRWTPVDVKQSPDCNQAQMDNERRCVVIFQEGQYGYTTFIILQEPNNMGMTLEDVDEALWQNMNAKTTYTLYSQETTTLDGEPTIVREYGLLGSDGEEWYARMMILFKGDKFYRVVAYSVNWGIFEEDRHAIQKLASEIHFTP